MSAAVVVSDTRSTTINLGKATLAAAPPLFHRPALDSHLQNTYQPKWLRLLLREGQSGYPLPAASQVNDLLSALQGVAGQAISSSGVNGKQGVVSEGQACIGPPDPRPQPDPILGQYAGVCIALCRDAQ